MVQRSVPLFQIQPGLQSRIDVRFSLPDAFFQIPPFCQAAGNC